MQVDLAFDQSRATGTGEELREEMKTMEEAITAALVAHIPRGNRGSISVVVSSGDSRDVE